MEEYVSIFSETSKTTTFSTFKMAIIYNIFQMESNLWCVSHFNVHSIIAKWSQPKFACEFHGSPTIQGEPTRIRKTRQSLRGTKLVRRLIWTSKNSPSYTSFALINIKVRARTVCRVLFSDTHTSLLNCISVLLLQKNINKRSKF